MSAPVAGRRKGQAAAAHTSPFSPTTNATADSEPSWLTGVSAPVTSGLASSTSPPAAGAAAPHTSPAAIPNASTDPLDFLSFDTAIPSPSPRPQKQQQQQQQITRTTSGATASPSPTGTVTPPPPAAAAGDTLDFLNFDTSDTAVHVVPSTSRAEPAHTVFSTGNDPYTRPANDTLVREYEALFAQFNQVEADLTRSSTGVAAIESGSHDVVREYEMADAELTQLRHKVVEAERTAQEARSSQQAHRQAEYAATEASRDQQKDAAMHAARDQWAGRLQAAKSAVRTQRASLEATQHEYENMRGAVTGAAATESAVRSLETRLGGLVRTMRGDFGLLVKPLLSRTIQEEMAAAAQQRADIHREDIKTRREALHTFTDARMQAFTAHMSDRVTSHQNAADTLFGELKRDMNDYREAHAEELRHRLLDFQASLKDSYATAKACVGEQLTRQLEMEERRLTQDNEAYTVQERQLQERLAQQLTLLRDRTKQERTLLERSRFTTSDASVGGAGREWKAAADRQVSQAVEDVTQRARRLHTDVRTEQEMLRSSVRRGDNAASTRGRDLPCSHAQEALLARKRALEEAFRHSTASLERWRSAVTPLADVVSRMGSSLQERRVRLAGLHEAVRETRRTWEHDVRQALSHALTPARDVDARRLVWPDEIMAGLVDDLTARLEQRQALEQRLRQDRHDFVGSQEGQVQQLKRAVKDSTDKLQTVFCLYDQVTQTGTHLEAHRIALEAAAEDMESAHAALQKDREAVDQLDTRIRLQAQKAQHMSAELETAATPFEDVTNYYTQHRNTTSTDGSSSLSSGRQQPGGVTKAATQPQHVISSHTTSTGRQNAAFPPTPARRGDESRDDGLAAWAQTPVLSRSPAHRQAGPRRYAANDARPPHTLSDASPQSVMRSSTTLATDFSTSLIGFDDDDDVIATDDAVLRDDDGQLCYQQQPQLQREPVPQMYSALPRATPRTHESPSIDAAPLVDQTNLGRSLTTPSTSLNPSSDG